MNRCGKAIFVLAILVSVIPLSVSILNAAGFQAAPSTKTAPAMTVAPSTQGAPAVQVAPSANMPGPLQVGLSLRITAPAGAAVLRPGEPCLVQWTWTGNIPSLNLWMEHIAPNGQADIWQVPGIGNDRIPNTGSKSILIPANWNSNQGARFRVKLAFGNVVAYSGVLTISSPAGAQPGGSGSTGPASFALTAPFANAILVAGEPAEIRWTTTGAVDRVQVGLLYKNKNEPNFNPNSFQALAMNVPNTGSAQVTLPPHLNSFFNLQSYALAVRSAAPPFTPQSLVEVKVYPRVSLQMIPVTTISQEKHSPYWRDTLRLQLDFSTYGLETLSQVSAKVKIYLQSTDQLVVQGTVSKQGFFNPGPYTVVIRFGVNRNGFVPLADGENYYSPDHGELPSGDYRVVVELFDPREPEPLRADNTKILFLKYRQGRT